MKIIKVSKKCSNKNEEHSKLKFVTRIAFFRIATFKLFNSNVD